jgi:CTP:phosphocholine cytidylyltransferase-like protein
MRAILLAAGMGTRLRPLTDDIPKALVEVAGESLFARRLRQLREAGIREISVVTGYKSEAFAPWLGESDLEFVRNEHYFDRNNLWSMYLVRDRLPGCLVLECDVRAADGLIPAAPPERSCVFVGYRAGMRDEWRVSFDEADRVRSIDTASGSGWILTGMSYWTPKDGSLLGRLLEEEAADRASDALFWDDLYKRNLDAIHLEAKRIGEGDWVEIDSLEDKLAFEASRALTVDRRI